MKVTVALQANTTYHYRVAATNLKGTTYGADITFTTLPLPPAATTGAATSVGISSAVLNGTVNANGATTTVTFQYGTTTSYGNVVTASQSPVTGNTDTAVSASLSSLASGVTYHYRVVAVNAGGTTYGADITFSTKSVPTVTTNVATGISSTGATLNGTVNANGTSTTVTFQYGTSTSYGTTVTASPSPVTGTSDTAVSASLTGLAKNTTYHFRVVGQNANGTVNGADMTFFTSSTPTATTAAASGISNTEATLNGKVNANGASTTVTFQYGTTTSYGSTAAATPSPVTGTTDTAVSVSLTGLTNNTTYHYRVVAVNTGGTTYGADMTFTTEPDKPSNGKTSGKEYAPGQLKEPGEPATGKAWGKESAPGHHKESGEPASGNTYGKEAAPGQHKESGEPATGKGHKKNK